MKSLSIAQRTQTNKRFGIVLLKQQLNAELAIARQALLVANLRIKAEGKSEALEKQAQALTGISDIQERIVGQIELS
jgi:ABC-type branched-subunit amino acid transport system ATPase component